MDPRVQILEGDITKQNVDAIVNAATPPPGRGRCGRAIHRAAGQSSAGNEDNRRVPTGEARVSKGYRLSPNGDSHRGPIWGGATGARTACSRAATGTASRRQKRRGEDNGVPLHQHRRYGFPWNGPRRSP